MGEAGKAVFLSYASQDAGAAGRMCETLRAAGVEVWFDQNELVGGDSWDAKIRKQIAECALFVPVISANTNARGEGYFRLEWKLAVDRSHLMAHDQPFLLPVVIDGTGDAAARVPPEFRAVQWTRLPDGETPEKFCGRVKKLLEGSVAGVADPGSLTARAPASARPATGKPSMRWLALALSAAAVVVALTIWSPWKKAPAANGPNPAGPSGQVPPAKSAPETAASLAEQARNNYYPFSTLGSLQLADEFSRRATELDPHDARAWGARANASARYLLRVLVSGEAAEQRARDAQSFANRALSLDKNETEALIALGIVAAHQHAQAQAETLYRRVLSVDPANAQAPPLLALVLRDTGRNAEALALLKRAVANAPRDPIAHLFLGFAYWAGWNFTKAAEQFDTAATVADFPQPRVYQAWVVFLQTGDLARLRTMLDSVDLVYSSDDSKLTYLLTCGLYERRADRVLEAVGRTSSAYFDGEATPKAWFSAFAYELDHKGNLARQQWLAAESVIRERLRANPQSEMLRMNLAITLAKLGRTVEAQTEFDPIEAVWREQPGAVRSIWLARFYAVTGNASRAVAMLRQGMNRLDHDPEIFKNATNLTIRFDPWWDPIRESAEFRELLAHPPEPPAPVDDEPAKKAAAAETKLDEKSVAVLAFENLSDDKANEYFSDGIADELLTTLQKIPGLRVAARTSAFSFKGKHATAQEVGEKLGMAHVVEGTVQKSGNRVKITARLSKAATNEEVWSKSFGPLELTDVFATQSEIAQAVVAELRGRLTGEAAAAQAEVARAQKGGTKNSEAHALYLQGRFHEAQYTRETIGPAVASFRRAVDLDPNFALAWAALAEAATSQGNYNYGVSDRPLAEAFAEARKAAEKSLELEPQLAEGHLALMQMQWFERDWKGARASARRALELAPSDARAVAAAADVANVFGDYPHALELATRAVTLDPLSAPVRFSLVSAHWDAGRLKEAEEEIRRLLTVNPGALNANLMLGLLVILQGRADEAAAIVEREADELNRNVGLAFARWGQQRRPEADAALQAVIEKGGGRVAFQVAEIYGYRGDVEQGYVWLERAYQQRDVGLTYTPVDRFLLPLRADTRWPAFLRKVGLSEEQLK